MFTQILTQRTNLRSLPTALIEWLFRWLGSPRTGYRLLVLVYEWWEDGL
jgi:hypothetical protein